MEMPHAVLPITVHIFLIKDNQVFLIKRANTGFMDGEWFGAAGRVDEKELITSAAVREAKEEIDVTINKEDLGEHLIMQFNNVTRGKIIIANFFIVKKWEGTPKNNEPDKCSEARWFSLNDLPEDMALFAKVALEGLLKGETFMEYGF